MVIWCVCHGFGQQVTAAKRPKNSALEVDLDFEHNVRPPPVITEEVTESIEKMIQKRIAKVGYSFLSIDFSLSHYLIVLFLSKHVVQSLILACEMYFDLQASILAAAIIMF